MKCTISGITSATNTTTTGTGGSSSSSLTSNRAGAGAGAGAGKAAAGTGAAQYKLYPGAPTLFPLLPLPPSSALRPLPSHSLLLLHPHSLPLLIPPPSSSPSRQPAGLDIHFGNITDGNLTCPANFSKVECDKFNSRREECPFITCPDACQPEGGFVNYLVSHPPSDYQQPPFPACCPPPSSLSPLRQPRRCFCPASSQIYSGCCAQG